MSERRSEKKCNSEKKSPSISEIPAEKAQLTGKNPVQITSADHEDHVITRRQKNQRSRKGKDFLKSQETPKSKEWLKSQTLNKSKSHRKEFFKIGELSNLFHIGVDSIRYYEKVGLLHPVRNADNNYRMYTLDDIRTMNTIRELLEIGFSTDEILAFEQDRTLAHVTDMLQKESDVIEEKINRLVNINRDLHSRLQAISDALEMDTSGAIRVLELPERPCLLITQESMKDDEISYRLAEFQMRHVAGQSEKPDPEKNDFQTQRKSATIGTCDCYILDTEAVDVESGDFPTRAVFLYSKYIDYPYNFALPAGKYLSLAYRGSFTQTPGFYRKMLAYCAEKGLTPAGDLMEFCHIDRYETSNAAEYLTELQLQVV